MQVSCRRQCSGTQTAQPMSRGEGLGRDGLARVTARQNLESARDSPVMEFEPGASAALGTIRPVHMGLQSSGPASTLSSEALVHRAE